jgi:hypothetical protein
MCQGAASSRSLGLVRGIRNEAIESVNCIFEHGWKIFGKGVPSAAAQTKICPVHHKNAYAPVCCISPLKVADNSLDLTLLREGNCHV